MSWNNSSKTNTLVLLIRINTDLLTDSYSENGFLNFITDAFYNYQNSEFSLGLWKGSLQPAT